MSVTKLEQIYLDKMDEASERIDTCEHLSAEYNSTHKLSYFESAVLQLRKTLECIAFAAIAPNKRAYQTLRMPKNYCTDYKAGEILQSLSKINEDFYPISLLPPVEVSPNNWHFERKTSGFLTKKAFESLYDRLGKYLHADNPWGNDKGIVNLNADIPTALPELRGLIRFHCTMIRTPEFLGTWVVEVPPNEKSRLLVAQAHGDFIVR